jgi:hypothetical protein
MTIKAVHPGPYEDDYRFCNWPSNGHLIKDVAELYLNKDMVILDPTYGLGRWWTQWQPKKLLMSDIKPNGIVPIVTQTDFLYLPWCGHTFDCVAFDPPYKLNGTPDPQVDKRYGVDVISTWRGRHDLIREGMEECVRVLKSKGILLLKCMDQVCSGAIRWQTIEFTNYGYELGLKLIDRFDMVGHARTQPMNGRKQMHAHSRGSTLLVFRKS